MYMEQQISIIIGLGFNRLVYKQLWQEQYLGTLLVCF